MEKTKPAKNCESCTMAMDSLWLYQQLGKYGKSMKVCNRDYRYAKHHNGQLMLSNSARPRTGNANGILSEAKEVIMQPHVDHEDELTTFSFIPKIFTALVFAFLLVGTTMKDTAHILEFRMTRPFIYHLHQRYSSGS